ncbi:hypothetical protein [Methylocystis sp. SB2]|uniref:hypothetical protein n=1 Tax=Methylocystis sp. (strain SB2) TaxID=743836 RepID=UPI00040DBB55|nr:hypothetical protein [Methylocystis sp. SB2]ULO25095.1 hypothetical protein LNB28_06825 [Methylocystis sp. SB2]
MIYASRDISEIETDALEDLARRYDERGLTEGGTHSLREVNIELARHQARMT